MKLSVLSKPYKLNGFEIVGDEAVSYDGNGKIVIVPDGVRKLASGLFWDNQIIEEVICPDSVEELGGDLFYNCRNLKRFTIGKNVVSMGDNPLQDVLILNWIINPLNSNIKNMYLSERKMVLFIVV